MREQRRARTEFEGVDGFGVDGGGGELLAGELGGEGHDGVWVIEG